MADEDREARDEIVKIRVSVLDEHDIFRRGIMSCLEEESSIEVVGGEPPPQPDVIVASPKQARHSADTAATVVCAGPRDRVRVDDDSGIMAVLPRGRLEPMQLIAAVYAAAAGLIVDDQTDSPDGELDSRSIDVLDLLAQGKATNDISRALGFSERTIKGVIHDVVDYLGASNRVEAVAEGIRRGWI